MRGREHFARARVTALMQALPCAAAAVVVMLACPPALRAEPSPARAGAVAPDFVLKTTDGRNLRLSEYRGDVVVLTFWAGWCGSCGPTLAGLNALRSESGSGAPTVLGVILDGDYGRAATVARSRNVGFPTLVDVRQTVGRLYAVQELPLTLLVDRDGIVRATWTAAESPPRDLGRRVEEIGQ